MAAGGSVAEVPCGASQGPPLVICPVAEDDLKPL